MSSDFTPISPNPFIVGNPVRGKGMFYGREAEFELVRKRFTDSTAEGGLLVFCGERRSGKTSILFQIQDGRLGPGFIPCLIDMQSMAIDSEVDFLAEISKLILASLSELGENVSPPDFTRGTRPASVFHRFVEDIHRAFPSKKLVLMFDEYELIEDKITAGVLTTDVLHIFASLMEHHSMFIIFTGSLSIDERNREYWAVFLGRSLFQRISYLDRRDAVRLITEPLEGRASYEAGVVDEIYRLTAGQPFYTQAICQSLVDYLNEHRTNVVTEEALSTVVDGIVDNPFPQMIFRWDGFEDDEKLVLAILAETLSDGEDYGQAQHLVDTLSARRYPLELDQSQISSTMENLFKHEILLKDQSTPPGYAYRIDLWRNWIRRMYSVWRVMRDLGMEIRPRARKRVRLLVPLALLPIAAVVAVFFWPRDGSDQRENRLLPPAAAAFVHMAVLPDTAVTHRDGRRIGLGTFSERVPSGEHEYQVMCTDYADTTFRLSVAPEESTSVRIQLRPLLGAAEIRTEPPGAAISVNGDDWGASPVTVGDLPAPEAHRVEARLDGYETQRMTFRIKPNSTSSIPVIRLLERTTDLAVTTDPPGARILTNGSYVGDAPVRIADLPVGRQRFRAELVGHVVKDTLIDIEDSTDQLHLTLFREPPGYLILQGDSLAAHMLIDGREVMRGTYNSREQELDVGWHEIRVRKHSGVEVRDSVFVNSKELVTYDFTARREISRQPRDGS